VGRPPTQHQLARRARLQLVLAIVSACLTALAIVAPAWIEAVTSLEPDGGSGELEWLIAAAFGLASLVFGLLTYRTRRQFTARAVAGSNG
jgi:uncharacterized membrane protein